MQAPQATPNTRPPQPLTSDVFLKNLLRSGLLARPDVEAALAEVEPRVQANPPLFAEHLIKTGRLSRFQAQKLMQGALLGLVMGPFQVLSILGKGGMGRVYLARDSRSKQLVAVKVLPPKRAREEANLLARFQREMNLSRMLDHPHLARSFEAGVQQGIHYIAMEFIPGQSLHKLVSGAGAMPVRRAAKLFAEAAAGLHHAHQNGLIHRDLKPSNILVTPNDHAKVLDLGLAIMQGEMASDRTIVGGQGYVVGTMDYIAPEQAEDALNVDPRADVYGLGCTLYYVVTGRPPFPGGNSLQKIMRHFTEEPTPAIELNPHLPPAFNVVLKKMMAKKPAERYQSADEVRQALLPWTRGEPVLPLDKKSDPAYRKTVAELESIEVPLEAVKEPILLQPRVAPSASPPATEPDPLQLFDPSPTYSWLDQLQPVFHWLAARAHKTVAGSILLGLLALLVAGLLYVLLRR